MKKLLTLGLLALAAFSAEGYKIISKIKVGGTGGWDVIDGGSEGIAGDTFVINGNSGYEIFRFYPVEDAELVIPGLVLKGSTTEIVVTRTLVVDDVETTTEVIAELSEIEEIVINGAPASGVGLAWSPKSTPRVVANHASPQTTPNSPAMTKAARQPQSAPTSGMSNGVRMAPMLPVAFEMP